MSAVPFRYAAYSHYYSPWFRRGPPLEDWQAPAPFPTVTVPFAPGDPHDHYPFVRRYPMLQYAAVPAYARTKDHAVMGSMARLPNSIVSPAPAGFQQMVPHYAYIHHTEGGVSPWVWDHDDDFEDAFEDDDDFEDIEDVFTMRYGEAEAKKKIKPFKAVSELFKTTPSGRTKAEELVVASKRLERELKRAAQRVQQAPLVQPTPRPGLTPVQTGMIIGGVALAAIGIGFFMGRNR